MSEWQEVTIDEIKANSKNAAVTGPFGSSISAKFFINSGVPVIRGSNLSEDIDKRLIDEDLAFVSVEKSKDFSRSIARKGDLIFTCWGTISQVGIIDDRSKFDEYVISNKQMKLTPDLNKADELFLYYLFSSPQVRKQILQNAIGSSVPGFNLGQLKSITIQLPPLEEQKRIRSLLDTLDRKIENLRKQNETLEQIAQTLFKHWFVDFEFPYDFAQGRPSADGKPYKSSGGEMVPSELGEIPAGWRIGALGEIAVFKNGKSPPEKSDDFEIPIYGSNGVIGHSDISNNQKTVIIGRVGSYCGSLFYCVDQCWVTDNAMTGFLKKHDSHAYLYFFLSCSRLNKLSGGSGQPLRNFSITAGKTVDVDLGRGLSREQRSGLTEE